VEWQEEQQKRPKIAMRLASCGTTPLFRDRSGQFTCATVKKYPLPCASKRWIGGKQITYRRIRIASYVALTEGCKRIGLIRSLKISAEVGIIRVKTDGICEATLRIGQSERLQSCARRPSSNRRILPREKIAWQIRHSEKELDVFCRAPRGTPGA